MTGQKNNACLMKSTWGVVAPSPARSFSRPDLAIPREVASEQSLTPFHQVSASIPSVNRNPRSTRLQDFRLWMVLQDIVHWESHSRAIENYPQSRREAQVVRLRRGALGGFRNQGRARNSDPAASQRPPHLLEVRMQSAGLRSVIAATIHVRADMGDRGVFRLCDAAVRLPDVRRDRRASPLVRRQEPIDHDVPLVSGGCPIDC